MRDRGSSPVRLPPSPTKSATRRCPSDSRARTPRPSDSSWPLSSRKENKTTQRTAASDHGPPPPLCHIKKESLDPRFRGDDATVQERRAGRAAIGDSCVTFSPARPSCPCPREYTGSTASP